MEIPGFHAVVPAGGAGTRLWPLSRASAPKFLHDLTGSGRTLLQQAVDRLTPLTGAGGVLVVTGTAHLPAVRAQLPDLGPGAVLAEPSPRDSMAAIGLAAAVLVERHGDVVVGSFAADHVIGEVGRFHDAVAQAVEAARAGRVVTLGIRATGPSTAFGYIHLGDRLGTPGAPDAHHVLGFTEKPDEETAAAYLATGAYRWNAGMFVVRAQVLLDHLARLQPTLHDGLRRIAAAWDGDRRDAVLAEVWPHLTKIAIDHAIAEPVAAEGGVAVVPGDFPWDDVGDFASLRDLLPTAAGTPRADDASRTPVDDASRTPVDDASRTLGDDAAVLRLDAPGTLVVARGERQVVVLGVPDAVVVDTPDALLVTTRAHAQQVKRAVDALRAGERTDLL